jgi:hypothetical protein
MIATLRFNAIVEISLLVVIGSIQYRLCKCVYYFSKWLTEISVFHSESQRRPVNRDARVRTV